MVVQYIVTVLFPIFKYRFKTNVSYQFNSFVGWWTSMILNLFTLFVGLRVSFIHNTFVCLFVWMWISETPSNTISTHKRKCNSNKIADNVSRSDIRNMVLIRCYFGSVLAEFELLILVYIYIFSNPRVSKWV